MSMSQVKNNPEMWTLPTDVKRGDRMKVISNEQSIRYCKEIYQLSY